MIGIDIDPIGGQNPVLDEFRLIGTDGTWPLRDGEVDLCVSDWTLEHVADPRHFTGELARVLRPGGAFIARTVSRKSALGLSARAVPNRHHPRLIARAQPDREARDVFPTVHRMNTEATLREALDADFDWAVGHRTGLREYLLRWPRLARVAESVEARLPAERQMTLVVYARRR